MKTIFVLGLFPDRNKTLMKHLCQNFRVITVRDHFYEVPPGFRPEIAEDIIGYDDSQFPHDTFSWEMYQGLKFTEKQLPKLVDCEDNTLLEKKEIVNIHEYGFKAFRLAYIFLKLAEKTRIDMVIVNADYSVFRRPAVIEAKRLGIPTLDIEHGFYAAMPETRALKSKSSMQGLFFVSDYINLDNQIEKEIWKEYYTTAGIEHVKDFLTHGTPNDVTNNYSLTKEAAADALKIDKEKFTITVAGTWLEARIPSSLFVGQLEDAEYYKTVFRALRQILDRKDIQIIVKLHPAFEKQRYFPEATNFFSKLSERTDVEVTLVTCDRLSEVIAVSDLIICPNPSSLLWECFLSYVPGLILPLPSIFDLKYDRKKLNSSNILTRNGCIRYVFDESDLTEAIQHFMEPSNYKIYKRKNEEIRKQKNIKLRTVDEKCQNICDWIKETIGDDEKESVVQIVETTENFKELAEVLKNAEKEIEQNNFIEGLKLLSQILEVRPSDTGSLQLMGDVYHKLGKETQAKQMWKLALEWKPNNLHLLERLGRPIKCSIIIPVYNQIHFTKMCIAAIQKNTPERWYEIIIIDNQSTDGTREFLQKTKNVKTISNDDNLGFSKACNQGAEAAENEFILFLNNDIKVVEGWLEPLLKIMVDDPDVAVVGSKLLYPDGKIQHAGVITVDDMVTNRPLDPWHIYYRLDGTFAEANKAREYSAVTGACLLTRKSIFQKLGGFDPAFWNGYEDVDYCYKIRAAGFKIVYQPKSVAIHYESKSGSERFVKNKENHKLLVSRWKGKIPLDIRRLKDGRTETLRPFRNYRRPQFQPYEATPA